MGQGNSGIAQHKRMAMGEKVTGMKRGGKVVDKDKDAMKSGGKVAKCAKCGGAAHSGKC